MLFDDEQLLDVGTNMANAFSRLSSWDLKKSVVCLLCVMMARVRVASIIWSWVWWHGLSEAWTLDKSALDKICFKSLLPRVTLRKTANREISQDLEVERNNINIQHIIIC